MLRSIPLFPPPRFGKKKLSVERLPDWPQKQWQYASSGKSCIYHILRSFKINGNVALPSYACASLLVPLRQLGLNPIFFDIDEQDLNPSISSLRKTLSNDANIQAVIFTSLYGNPAALADAEEVCKEYGVLLIDDAAQCFGATLAGRSLGTFGGAGFFSFSPGKPTAAHMGGFFWSSSPNVYQIDRSKHPLVHRLRWFFFKVQRLEYWRWKWGAKAWFFLRKIFDKLEQKIDLWNDDLESFENEILGGVLHALQDNEFSFRMNTMAKIVEKSTKWSGVRLVQAVRGNAHTHKWVMVFDDIFRAQKFKEALLQSKITFLGGYAPLAHGCSTTDGLVGRIVELPILQNTSEMDELISFVDHYLRGNEWDH